jgi:RIO kinase 1
VIQEVVRPLMSGKEAQIYLVQSGGELRVAKVYKEAQDRTFKQRAEYTEGRGGRNSRTQRAIGKRSRFGRSLDEQSWRSAEVEIIHRLSAVGVRVPRPHLYLDGILVMELITDASGHPAPRLADLRLGPAEAGAVFHALLGEVVRMLCAGVVHGDLSDFNVLMGGSGPVIIDFPQAVDPARNQNARKLLLRDVDNLVQFHATASPGLRKLPWGQELWSLYEKGELTPETVLTGRYTPPARVADTASVLAEIAAVAQEAERMGRVPGPGGARRSQPRPPAPAQARGGPPGRPPTDRAPAGRPPDPRPPAGRPPDARPPSGRPPAARGPSDRSPGGHGPSDRGPAGRGPAPHPPAPAPGGAPAPGQAQHRRRHRSRRGGRPQGPGGGG